MGIGIETLAVVTVGTTGTQVSTSGLCATLYITADPGNTTKWLAIQSGATTYGLGSFGVVLSAGQSWTFAAPYPTRPGQSQLDLSKFYVVGSAAGTVCHISYLERLGQ